VITRANHGNFPDGAQTFLSVEHLLTNLRKNIRIFESKVTIMGLTRDEATAAAKKDLADRLSVDESTVKELSVTEKDFPDMSLGAAVNGEMSAQMISSGWEIKLGVDGKTYEYRADKYQVRLVDFDGCNYLIQ